MQTYVVTGKPIYLRSGCKNRQAKGQRGKGQRIKPSASGRGTLQETHPGPGKPPTHVQAARVRPTGVDQAATRGAVTSPVIDTLAVEEPGILSLQK